MTGPGTAGERPAEGRLAAISAALLTGGVSSRMGRDKAHLPLAGVPLAVQLARLLTTLFEDVLIVGGEPPGDAPGRRVADPPGPRCALRGLVGALEAARGERVLVIATDLPRLSPELLLALVAWPEADVVLPRSERGLEPLCALWHRAAVLPRARAQLAAGRLALHELVSQGSVSRLEGDDLRAVDPDGGALANANTPEEWEALAHEAKPGG